MSAVFAALQAPAVMPNPLGQLVTKQLRPLLKELDKHTGAVFIDALMSNGFEMDDNLYVVRPSSNAECATIRVGIRLDGELNAMQPFLPQLIQWLANSAAQLDIARMGCAHVKERRSLEALNLLAAESEVAV